MKSWCKRFFGGFFRNRYATDDAVGGIMNTLIGFFAAFFLLLFLLFGGYMLSFGSLYNRAPQFSRTVSGVFDDISALNISDGLARTDTVVNSIDNAADAVYAAEGYAVIVDTRPMETTFDAFTPYYVAKDGSGGEISEEEYGQLSAVRKNGYSFRVRYSGVAVDTAANAPTYEEYFAAADESAKTSYNELQAKRAQLDEKEYADNLYVLYTLAKYPEIAKIDSYSYAPTLRTYELNAIAQCAEDRYLAIFDNGVFGSFRTSDGIEVEFAGSYAHSDDWQSGGNADAFVKKAFRASAMLNLNLYFMHSFRILGFMLLGYAVCVTVCFVVCRIAKTRFGYRLGGSITAVGAFVFFSGLFAGIACFALSFCLPRYTVMNLAPLLFGAILLTRTLVLAVWETVADGKEEDAMYA